MIMFILLSWVIWRAGLFVVAWLGSYLLPFAPRFPYSDIFFFPSGLPSWLWSFANFDGVHYLTILREGYAAQFTQVFFPAYPLIIRGLHLIFPFLSDIVLAITFSSICFLGALYMLSRLLLLDYQPKQVRWMLLFLMTFPTAFFFGSVYTESFFLLLVASSFYLVRQKQTLGSGIVAGLGAATRVVGIVLLPALLWEQWKQRVYLLRSPILYLAPLGLVGYMGYLWRYFGDPLYFWHVQPVFGAARAGSGVILLPQVLWRYVKILLTLPVSAEAFWIAFLEAASLGVCLLLLWQAYRKKVRSSYLLFSLICVIIPTLTGTLSSMPRYIVVAFPMYIALGLLPSRFWKVVLLVLNIGLQITLTILFTRGHWVS